MPVAVSDSGAGAFIAIFILVLIFVAALYARHRGHLRNAKVVMLIAVAIGLCVAYILMAVFFR